MSEGDKQVYGGRYEIIRKVARGGMADVFLARDQLLDRPVALKVLFAELSVDPSFVERFRREAQNAARLSHPNIVSVYDWGQDASTYFIVMEFVDGKPLSALLRERGPFTPQRAAVIGAEVAAALSFAHRNGVVHRDIKPGNVLIDERGLVKVADFGIARARNTSENLTQTGAVMGTATYFSPEQAQGHNVDQRSDIYSLGVVLHEIVAGKAPFQGDNPVTIAYKHVREEPPSLTDVDPSISPAYAAIVSRCMAKSPASRYQNAEELGADLVRFHNGQPISIPRGPASATRAQATYANATRAIPSVTTAGTPGKEPSDKGVKGPLLVFLGLLIALGIGGAVLYKVTSGEPEVKLVDVPSVVGDNVNDATTELKNAGFTVNIEHKDDSATKDSVLSQDPSSGQANKGSAVKLVVSNGLKQVSVPDVTGKTKDAAVSELEDAGLTAVVNEVFDDAKTGTVFAQTPSTGTVNSGTKVILSVSKGSEQVEVPDLEGFTVSGATNLLTEKGLKTTRPEGTVDSDIVVGTTPSAGTMVDKNTNISLVVQIRSTTTSTTTTVPADEENGDVGGGISGRANG